jgi:cell division protein FtsQ
MEDSDGDDSSCPRPRVDWQGGGSSKRNSQRSHWWRPAGTAGRVLLLLTVLAVLGTLGTSAYLLKTWLGRDAHFRIEGASNIKATGLTEVSRAEMLPVFGEDIGRNIFFVPLSERRRQLEEIPWIQSDTVMRLLPDQIQVSVVERQPIAFTRQGQQIGLVDASGILLTMPAAMMAQHHYSFPVVTGISAREPLSARKARMAVYQRLVSDLDASGQKLSTQISEVDLTDPEDAHVIMQDDTILLHFGQDQFLERYQRYKAHIAEWRQQYPRLAAVDLRYDQQVVLEMAPGTDVAQTAADDQSAANTAHEKQPTLQAVDNDHVAGKSTAKHPSLAKAATRRPPAHESALVSKAKTGKAGAKSAGNGSAKSKAAAAKNKAAKAKAVKAKADQKKRMQAKRAVLNLNRQKTAATSHAAASAEIGQ